MPVRQPQPIQVLLLVALLCLVWGSTWVVIKVGLTDLPVFGSAAVRFGLAWLVMALVAPRLHALEGGERPPLWMWVQLGATNFGISYALVYWSESVLPSGLVSVLWGVFPLIMALLSHRFLPGERLSLLATLGFLTGFAGVVLLFWNDLQDLGTGAIWAGAVLLFSPLVTAIGTVILKRHGGHISSVLVNRNGMAVGAAMLGTMSVIRGEAAPWQWCWTATAAGSVLYLALIGTCLAFTLYFWLLRFARANSLSLIAYVAPCVALLLGWAILDEPIYASTMAGTILVLVGVAFTRR